MIMVKKKLDKKGFTLAELLIVVAIIAVLVAVSVPIFGSKLEKAREATDVANMRAAKAAAASMYLEDDSADFTDAFLYDADKGILVDAGADVEGYGQGTKTKGGVGYPGYDQDAEHKGQILQVKINPPVTADGEVEIDISWIDKK